jgi:hypothetical protein
MRISHRLKFIFFSNPKTGSESVRKLLDPYSDITGVPFWEATPDEPFYSHIRPIEVRDLFYQRGWIFEDYFRFTFVRNPWARLVSLYQMIFAARGRSLTGANAAFRNLLARHPSRAGFRRWLRTVQTDGPGAGGPANQRWQRYGSYSLRAYAGDENGDLLVDRVIRLESIEVELPRTLADLGISGAREMSIPRVNTRRHQPYTWYYDSASAKLVGQMYAEDIERYKYRFGG